MKTLLTTIAISISFLSVKAEHKISALNLKMFDNGIFSVVLDNQKVHSHNGFFSTPTIEPGYHRLKVVRHYPAPHGHSMKKVVYNGWISIPPKSVVYANITCHNQYDVVKVEPYFCPPVGGECGNGWDDDECGGYGHVHSDHCGGGNGWNSPVPPLVPMCMSHMEFMQLKSSIESQSFENGRLQIAKQALAYNHFTSAQIADLMTAFSFESTRLDFAKSAYGKVIDKQNFYLVNNAFSFESTIHELNRYIAGK